MLSRRPFPFAPFVLSLVGLAFCLWVSLSGGKSLCITDGCSLFQDFSLAGLSLWSTGTAFFGLTLLACLLRLSRIALLFSAFALATDIALMAVMAFTAPCMNCLIVGLILALCFFTLLRENAPHRRARRSPLLLTWALLFVISSGGILRDTSEPWSPLPLPEHTAVQVFFSPSCRACQTLVEQAPSLSDAAWFPVAEDSRDIWLISAMTKHLEAGKPLHEAITSAQHDIPGLADAPDLMALPSYRFGLLRPEMLLLQFRLWKNRARVLAAGSDRLPFVQFMGLPAFLRNEATPPASTLRSEELQSASELPGIDLGVAGFCGGDAPQNCKNDNSVKKSLPESSGLIDTSGMAQ